MKVLFIGQKFGNSHLQYKSLKKLYKKVDLINTKKILPFFKITIKIFFHISPVIFENFISKKILKKVNSQYDLIYVKSGEFISRNLILKLKKKTKKIIFFCNDNPFVKRDKHRWTLFHKASKYYDLIVYQDKSRIKLSKSLGLKNGILIYPPYDRNIHRKWKINKTEKTKYTNNIVFIGTWSPKKAFFFLRLKKLGLDFKIYGTGWNKDPNYELLKSFVKLGHVENPRYSKIIQNSKITLCLFSEDNLDTITARTIEIPAIGSLLMCFKTNAVSKLFKEDREAIFFKTPKECFEKCNYYLNNIVKAQRIAKKGNFKITKLKKLSNEDFVKKIVNSLF